MFELLARHGLDHVRQQEGENHKPRSKKTTLHSETSPFGVPPAEKESVRKPKCKPKAQAVAQPPRLE